jgi:uncharacterized protein YecE (DUF72 family)
MIRIGTCSWKYDSWKGIIYPDVSKFNYLQEYSGHFNTVEIDQWFWSLHAVDKVTLPLKKTVKEYNESVPDDFRFTVKIPNSLTLTHFYKKKKTDTLIANPHFLNAGLFNSFLDSLKSMHSKIGVLMFQFEYLNKEKMGNQMQFIEMFESFLEKTDVECELGIEIRNPNYLNKNFFEFLSRNNLSMVFLQGYYMPPVWEVFNNHKDLIKDTVVLRLHGPDRKGIEEKTGNIWNSIVENRDEELEKISGIIGFLESKKVDTYVNVNNHFEGSAPLTIKKLKEKLTN